MYSTETRVILAGAGPGDPELMTVGAIRALEQAEVILFDALVNDQILAHARLECLLIDVGKRKGNHRFSQDEINQMILFYSQRFSRVLRLKGGDPYVFGRGSEEEDYLRRHGINARVIPGISSAIAGPAAAGIPVTRRGVSESFWVITGTNAAGKLSGDLELAARSSATVVVLMGLSKLKEIMTLFRGHRSVNEPAAVILNATMPDQHIFAGSITSLEHQMQGMEPSAPGIIVIGKVAASACLTQIPEEEAVKMKLAV
jgi:uroporphyrin-III C-methyltransferase